jgi:hypothetical protein
LSKCKGEFTGKVKKPEDIPANPDKTYKRKFKGFGDWLGTGRLSNRFRKYRPFREAREFVRKIELKNGNEWNKYCKAQIPHKGTKPRDLPSTPALNDRRDR